jgi:hypothetical protein
LDSTTGATTEELLAVNDCLFRLKTASLTVTGGANLNWRVFRNDATGTFRFEIKNGSSPYTLSGNPYLDLGTGLESQDIGVSNPSLVTLETLRAAIDADASLVCALPSGLRFAKVNGDQSGVYGITVFAGHNYVIGDWMTFWDFSAGKLVGVKLNGVIATQLSFDQGFSPSGCSFAPVNVKNNQIIGPMATPAAGIYLRDSFTSVLTTATIPFWYWEVVPYSTSFPIFFNDSTPFRASWLSRNDPGFVPPVFVNANNVIYIYTGSNNQTKRPHDGYPFKYDGISVYREGLPPLAYTPSTAVGAAGVISGSYKYKAAYVQYDKRGNINFGRISAPSTALQLTAQKAVITIPTIDDPSGNLPFATVNGAQAGVTTITVFAGYTLGLGDWVKILDSNGFLSKTRQITGLTATSITISGPAVSVNNNDTIRVTDRTGFSSRFAVISAIQTNVTSLTIISGGSSIYCSIEVGDVIVFYDTRISKYTTRLVETLSTTTIGFASQSPVNVDPNIDSRITPNTRVRLWRTKAGGNLFYELTDIAASYNYFNAINPIVYTDNIADTALGAQLIEPPIGKEQDAPPRARFACVHQGTRVSAGDDMNPNTVAIYSTQDPESVPLASNYFDVPSSIRGPITGLISRTDDMLSITKPNAYYEASGDLDGNAFTVRAIKEGDYGIAAHKSLFKITDMIIGIGKLGPATLRVGRYFPDRGLLAETGLNATDRDPNTGEAVAPAFWNNPNLALLQAVAINDYTGRQYLVYVPSTAGFASGVSQSGAVCFTLDYSQDNIWFDRKYSDSIEPSGGFAIYADTLYFLSKCFGGSNPAKESGHLFRELGPTSTFTTTTQFYADNHLPITYTYKPTWQIIQQPSIDKEFLWFKIFSMPGIYDIDRFAPFTMTVTVYKDFVESNPIGTFTLSIASISQFEAKSKLPSTKARAILYSMVVSALGQAPSITGYEEVVSLSYIPENPR